MLSAEIAELACSRLARVTRRDFGAVVRIQVETSCSAVSVAGNLVGVNMVCYFSVLAHVRVIHT
jgi:hypothetical protein